MTPGARKTVGLLALAGVAAATIGLVRATGHRDVHARDAIPADAFLVAILDVDRLRASPLGMAILRGPAERLLGDRATAATCGFDPVDRIREVAIGVPMDETGDFGVSIRADLTRDELLGCARRVMEARGKSDAAVQSRQRGSFTVVEPGGAGARYPALAFRDGGPFLLAPAGWLEKMIDAADGRLPGAARASGHAEVLRRLEQPAPEPGFALEGTVLLPEEMRARIGREMGAEGAGGADGSALMAGVLGVEAAGLGLVAGDTRGAETRVVVDLSCDAEPACAAVGRLVEKTRSDWSRRPAVALLGAAPLLDNLALDGRGLALRITTHAPAERVARSLERALAALAPSSSPAATTVPGVSSDPLRGAPARGGAGLPR